MNALQHPIAWFVATLAVATAGIVLGWRLGAHNAKQAALNNVPHEPAINPLDERAKLRAAALDSVADAVLVTDTEGRICDCNSWSLTLFDRHRDDVEGQYMSTLRRFDSHDQSEPHRLATEHSVWVGECWAKQPDGGMKMCQVRVMAIRDERARIVAFAESYRPVIYNQNIEQDVRDLLYAVRTFEPTGSRADQHSFANEELRALRVGFRDLEHVVRQYERLLPSLSADDPLSESIAGVAADARAAVTAVGVSALLEEIPRTLARLRGHMQSLATEETDPVATAGPESRRQSESRRG